MAFETIRLEHVPTTHAVHAALFRDVTNASVLQAQLQARNPDFEYAFIDASSIVSRLHVLAATYKALTILLDGTLKTPNVHSEIVCSLSPSTNISEAYRRWGVTAATKNLIVIKVIFSTEARPKPPSAEELWAHLMSSVDGSPAALSDDEIRTCTDWSKIRKYYKLNGAPGIESKAEGSERVEELGVLALSGMALRGL